MRLSQLLRCAIVLAVVVAAGCDRDVDSPTAPAKVPSGPNALIVSNGYSDVSVGANFACAVRAVDGGLVCWGDPDYGKTTPPTTGSYRQVSAGTQHACALRSDYFVVCWGRNYSGEIQPPATTFSQVSAGNLHTCGVRMDNRLVACWGDAPTPPAVAFTQVNVDSGPECGVTFAEGRVLCWMGVTTVPPAVYKQVDVGAGYACGVLNTGSLLCWGQNLHGESSPPSGTYTQVSAAYTHTCAIRASDRGVVCWGQDRSGMLNAPAGAYTKVSAGNSNACAIRSSDLALVCWGNTSYGMSSPPGISTAHAAPSASFTVPASVVALDTFFLNLYSARVNGYSQATSFTYQFDCGDGKGYGAVQTANYTRCPTRVAGARVVRGKVIDQDGDTASYKITVPVKLRLDTVTFTSTAPSALPIEETYTVSAKAKSGRPVTFSTNLLNKCRYNVGNVITFYGIGVCTIYADVKGDSAWAPAAQAKQTTKAIWPFTGFFTTVRNEPEVNAMPAGRYVRLIFSLGGNRSYSGAVVSTMLTQVVTCDPTVTPYTVTTSSLVGTAGVTYDSATARYTLTWKTDAAWKGSCRLVRITLNDGTMHSLRFKFT